jgi:hypothetical protein
VLRCRRVRRRTFGVLLEMGDTKVDSGQIDVKHRE